MSKELIMTLGNMTEQEVLMNLIDQGEWTCADGSVFLHDNWDDQEDY